MNIKTSILFRVYLLGAFCALFGVAVLGKVYMIQTDKKNNWKAMADSLNTKVFSIPAERGNIYSADDKLLATSVPYFELHIDFGSSAMTDEIFNRNVDSLAHYMWKNFNQKSESAYRRDLKAARKQKKRYYLLWPKADYTLLKKIKQWPLFREGKFKGGLIVETHQERTNPYGYLAKRTIGLKRTNAANVGLEEAADSLLTGVKGKMQKQKIAGGEWIPIKSVGQIEPKNGYDIITTIDLGLQDITTSTLLQQLTAYDAEFGSAILMEVKTGAIKAIANLGKLKDGGYAEIYNHAIGLSNEPGSVFKTAGYLALFDDGYITPNDSINTNHASAQFGPQRLTDDGHNTQYTFLTPGKALAISSNVAIAKWLTEKYGSNKSKYYDKLVQFGLTKPTGIELKGEVSPFIRTPDKWSQLSLPWMAHGYEVKLTPLQILAFYNAIANNGVRVKPYLIQQVVDNGKVIRDNGKNIQQQKICSPQAAAWAKEILLRVTEDPNGTAKSIKSPYYRIAGKTGTAKISKGKEGYSNENLSSFVGFFPADNPLYSCIVVVGGPQGLLNTGGAVSAPIFRIMADKIITSNISSNVAVNKDSARTNQLLPMVKGTVDAIKAINDRFKIKFDFKEDWTYAALQQVAPKKIRYANQDADEQVMPNVKGMLLDDALYLLENRGLKVAFYGKGKVITQSVAPGSMLPGSGKVELVLN